VPRVRLLFAHTKLFSFLSAASRSGIVPSRTSLPRRHLSRRAGQVFTGLPAVPVEVVWVVSEAVFTLLYAGGKGRVRAIAETWAVTTDEGDS
jgi:hypothetical protein